MGDMLSNSDQIGRTLWEISQTRYVEFVYLDKIDLFPRIELWYDRKGEFIKAMLRKKILNKSGEKAVRKEIRETEGIAHPVSNKIFRKHVKGHIKTPNQVLERIMKLEDNVVKEKTLKDEVSIDKIPEEYTPEAVEPNTEEKTIYEEDKKSERPMFSVIITGNGVKPDDLKEAVKSIYNQKLKKEEIETIIVIHGDTSEDRSELDDEQSYWKNNLHPVKYESLDESTAVQKNRGVELASGEWLMFMDPEDRLTDKLDDLKDSINSLTGIDIIYSTILAVSSNPDTDTVDGKKNANEPSVTPIMAGNTIFTHGRFYRTDIWKERKLQFTDGLGVYEDLGLTSMLSSRMFQQPVQVLGIPTYIWTAFEQDMSKSIINGHPAAEVFMEQYVNATAGIFINEGVRDTITPDVAFHSCIGSLLHCYFFTQAFTYGFGANRIITNDNICRKLLTTIKKTFGVHNKEIVEFIYNHPDMYNSCRFDVLNESSIPFIETVNFIEWFNYLHEDIGESPYTISINK